jgi:hypothetical protein
MIPAVVSPAILPAAAGAGGPRFMDHRRTEIPFASPVCGAPLHAAVLAGTFTRSGDFDRMWDLP